MSVAYLLLVCYIFGSYGNTQHQTFKRESSYNQSLIIGGRAVDIHDHPYMSYLQVKFELTDSSPTFSCGATILTHKVVLTAGHCFVYYENLIIIRLSIGSHYPSQGLYYYTTNYTVHPLFDPPEPQYDIGVARTNSEMVFDYKSTKPVVWAAAGTFVGAKTTVTVVGWGYTVAGHEESLARTLREATIPVLSQAECKEAYRDYHTKTTISNVLFCAGIRKKNGKDVCHGDSGGPAVNRKKIQVGVIAKAAECGVDGIPSIYTDIASLHGWITTQINAKYIHN